MIEKERQKRLLAMLNKNSIIREDSLKSSHASLTRSDYFL